MLHLVVHAGFHKTGTTTVQKTLRANAPVLKQHLRVFLRPRMVALCEAARAWSVSRGALDMGHFRYELAELAQGWDPGDPRPVLLASEDLAGHMPGRRGLTTYDATPPLMKALADTVAQVHPGADIRFFFSTRASAPWLASCHAQHLRAVRMVLDAPTYADRYRASANLDAVIDAVSEAVTPAPVLRHALEESAGRALGPLDPLLDLCGLPDTVRDRLRPQPVANRRHDPAILLALLAANRDHADPDALRAAKRAILATAQER